MIDRTRIGRVAHETMGRPMTARPASTAKAARPAPSSADLVTAFTLTLTGIGGGVGIVGAAWAAGLPVAVSFTVEVDGRLPDGTPLPAAVPAVDADAVPHCFMVDCARPSHI